MLPSAARAAVAAFAGATEEGGNFAHRLFKHYNENANGLSR